MLTEVESRIELMERFKRYIDEQNSIRVYEYYSDDERSLNRIFGKLINFKGMDLRGMSFDGLDLSCAVFDDCSLGLASFRGATLKSCSIINANLSGARFDDCFLDSVDLSQSNLKESNFRAAIIKNPHTYLTSFEGCDFTGSRFVGNFDFYKTDFKGAKGVNIVQFCVNGVVGYIFNGKLNVNGMNGDVDSIRKLFTKLIVN